MQPNGSRYAPSGYWWAGRENAALPEPALSHTNCLKTRTPSLRAARFAATTMAPALFAGDRVHRSRMGTSYFTQETEPQWEYTAIGQTKKLYVSSAEPQGLPWCSVVSDHDDLSTGDALSDPD